MSVVRAVVIHEFGGRDKLRLEDVSEPKLFPDAVRIRIRAAGVNPVDCKTREGRQEPRFPHVFPVVLGWDAAGVVEEVGPATRWFKPGDEVYAYCRKHFVGEGTYTEQVVVPDGFVARLPRNLNFAEAAAVPLAALTAYQCLVEQLQIKPGETVLVHAAAGGVGHFAVQIARELGAKPIGTASPRNHDFLRELGCIDAIDYHEGDFPGVDAAIDPIGGETLEKTLSVAGRTVSIVQPGDTHGYHFVRPSGAELSVLTGWIEDGRVRVHLDDTFPLDEAAAAHERLEEGHVRGKIALTVSE
ncbi:MAG: NADP-dependent oxidoreductase [Actinobacteria bacterium]|nr:MAG: NADP-dependent oxidoreductase [Actinomycetota bacterium]